MFQRTRAACGGVKRNGCVAARRLRQLAAAPRCHPESRSIGSVRADDQIVVVNHQISHRGGRHVLPQRLPVLSIVDREEYLAFGAGEEQAGLLRSSRTTLTGPIARQPVHDFGPRRRRCRASCTCGRMSSRRIRVDRDVRQAASAWPASICDTLSQALSAGGVHVLSTSGRASRVTCTSPSSVPAQIT